GGRVAVAAAVYVHVYVCVDVDGLQWVSERGWGGGADGGYLPLGAAAPGAGWAAFCRAIHSRIELAHSWARRGSLISLHFSASCFSLAMIWMTWSLQSVRAVWSRI